MSILNTTNYPVEVQLDIRNPWGPSVKVNNITVYTKSKISITSQEDLKKLIPIERYLLLTVVGELQPIKKNTKNMTKKEESKEEKLDIKVLEKLDKKDKKDKKDKQDKPDKVYKKRTKKEVTHGLEETDKEV